MGELVEQSKGSMECLLLEKGEGVSEVARGKVGEGPSHTQEEDKKLNA